MNKINYHILNGGMTHLSPEIVRLILNNSNKTNENGKKDHYFYITNFGKIVGSNKNIKAVYNPIFEQFDSFKNYKYINNSLQLILILLTIKLKETKLFLHGTIKIFNKPVLYMLVLLLCSRKKLNHINLISWGQGCFSYTHRKKLSSFITKIYSKFINNISSLITISDGDHLMANDLYPSANIIKCGYIRETDDFIIKKNKEKLTIIVSHSAWLHNNHLSSFNQIKHLKDENIEVICPLCYGDMNYIKEVIKNGQKLFNNKFTYFTDLKTRDEYTALLNSAHVYITNAEIQTGLFAANTSMMGGAHIFVSGNLLYSLKKEGFIINNTAEISSRNFKSLININLNVYENNKINMRKKCDKTIQTWKDIYNKK